MCPRQKNFKNLSGGRGTLYGPKFLTCMETTLKSVVILIKFTQDMCMESIELTALNDSFLKSPLSNFRIETKHTIFSSQSFLIKKRDCRL